MAVKLRLSLQQKITYSVVSIIIFFGALASIISFYQTKNSLSAEVMSGLLISTVAQAHETTQVLHQSEGIVRELAIHPAINNLLSPESEVKKTTPLALETLNRYNINSMFLSLYVLDQVGNTVVSTDPRMLNQNYAFRDYYRLAMQGESHLDIAQGVTTQELGYYFAYPVRNEQNEVMGVVVAKLNPGEIYDTLTPHKQYGLHISLIDASGVIVYSTDADKIMHSLAPLSADTLNWIQTTRRFAETSFAPLDYQELSSLLPSLSTKPLSLTITDEHDGVDEVLSASRLGDYPVYILVEAEVEKISALAYQAAITIGGVVLMAAIAATVIIWWLISRLFAPLQKLRLFAESLSAGNFASDLRVETGDELEDLASHFRKMSQQLQISQEHIEAKIRERTEELERANRLMVGRELKMIELKKALADKDKTNA